jgi:hypothetical protein
MAEPSPLGSALSVPLPVEKHRTLHIAMSVAEQGWALYPVYPVDAEGVCTCSKRERCDDPGKHPATPHGIDDASSDPERIAQIFSRLPGANVGLRTGAGSGVVALDVDSWHGGGQSVKHLEQQHGKLPGTRLHQSGSSDLHHFFAFPQGVDRLPSRTIAPGVELKADGSGVVLPPSRHWTGGEYHVLIDGPLAPLPDWTAEMARELRVLEGGGVGNAAHPTESRFELPEHIYKGCRNKTLYRYGCSLRAHGFDYASILAELQQANEERCSPPLDDAEVQKITVSAAGHAPGNASTATPEVLEALDDIEAALWASSWPGVGGKSERSVVVALIKAARQHGTLIPAGVRVSIATRPLAEDAEMPHRSLMRAVARLRHSGMIRKDDANRRAAEAGAFVLVHPGRGPGCAAARANCHHSTTPPTSAEDLGSSKATESMNDDTLRGRAPFTAPRLRWGRSLGRTCEATVDALERAGGEATVKDLAGMLHARRPRDLRRRSVSRLEEAGVVERDGEAVRLRPDWLEALELERETNGEKLAARLERKLHEWQREAYRQRLAERERGVTW